MVHAGSPRSVLSACSRFTLHRISETETECMAYAPPFCRIQFDRVWHKPFGVVRRGPLASAMHRQERSPLRRTRQNPAPASTYGARAVITTYTDCPGFPFRQK